MNKEPETYKCLRCGKRFTKYGRQAEILEEVQNLFAEYRVLINDPTFEKIRYTTLNMVEAEAKCCNEPFIVHTYPEKGDLR